MNKYLTLLLLALGFWAPTETALAHAMSDSFLRLDVQSDAINGEWHIAVRDLANIFDLDAHEGGAITWGDLRVKNQEIASYALDHLLISTPNAPCVTTADAQLVDHHGDGAYSVLRFHATCHEALKTALVIEYSLLFAQDAEHRGLLNLSYGGGKTQTGVFAKDSPRLTISLTEPGSFAQAAGFVKTGILHIWEGYDHILFLLTLLFPAALVLVNRRAEPAATFAAVAKDILQVVTSFTLAHSLTLGMATLGVVSLPSRLVEAIIAVSVLFSALNNLGRWVGEKRWLVAFAFGLIHGFGFASVLTDLGLPKQALLTALVAFNIGVEIGQLAIVLALLPVLFLLRRTLFYRRVILLGGSSVAALLSLCWIIERVADVKFMPF